MDERTRSPRPAGRGGSATGSGKRRQRAEAAGSPLGQLARQKGLEIRDRAVGVVEQSASRRIGKAADGLSSFVNALRNAGEALGGPGTSRLADYPIEMADRLAILAEHLRESEPRELAREVEDLARRYPELFLGGMLLAGVATGRFLRASAANIEDAPRAGAAKPRSRRKSSASVSRNVRSGVSSGDAPNYSGSRDYDEAEDGQYASSGTRRGGTGDPGAGANYASDRDYAGAAPARRTSKRSSTGAAGKGAGKTVSRTRSRVPAKADPMPGGGRTSRE